MKPVNTNNSEHYKWGNGSDGWHLLKSDKLSVIEERVSPGESEVRHFHKHSQQFFYVLSGIVTIEISEVRHTVESGQGIHVPAGIPHQLMNLSTSEIRFLVISEPRSHGDRVSA
ncbi:cupin domain-containing protein [Microbulbifer variabilis]|uniref:cupin domain-containing protein n=1 Tax=Microbulbifer variabilis TaxID=266805 RepID=UPI0003668CD9|nr:cupin domain-containing protein [Microbulbifer variabilis]